MTDDTATRLDFDDDSRSFVESGSFIHNHNPLPSKTGTLQRLSNKFLADFDEILRRGGDWPEDE